MSRSTNRRTHLLGLTMILCGAVSSLFPPGYAQRQPGQVATRAAIVREEASRPAALAQQTATYSLRPRPLDADAATTARVTESYGKLPMSFEANQGQSNARVKFLSRGAGYTLFLTEREAVLSLSMPAARDAHQESPSGASANNRTTQAAKAKSAVVRMQLAGGNRAPQIEGQDRLSGTSNYFVGNDPRKWQSSVPTFGKVKYTGVYPGINMLYYGNNQELEYDFIVAPGVDPRVIRLVFKGARKISVDAAGDLLLDTAGGQVRQRRPVLYQEVDGERRKVAGGYVRRGKREVGFRVGAHDATRPLVIDPVLSYSTYLGGSGGSGNDGYDIAVDSAGSAYVMGSTNSLDFPTANPFDPTRSGGGDAFVTKFAADGTSLVYSTYLGGSTGDSGNGGIAVDASGSAYVLGTTNSLDFPTVNPFDATLGGSFDAFVTKFAPDGRSLVYSTYLGGSSTTGRGQDWGDGGIAVDAAGSAYVIGETISSDFPTVNPFDATFSGTQDAFVSKISDTAAPPADPIRVVLSRDGGGNLVATITVTNPLADPVPGVQMTLVRASTLDGSAFVDGVPVPQSFGTVNPGQSVTATVTFPGTAGVPAGFSGLVRVDLSYTGGTYGETEQVVTP